MKLLGLKAALTMAMAALVLGGCSQGELAATGEGQGSDSVVWYDDELSGCFAENDKGEVVEVPCDQTEPHYEY